MLAMMALIFYLSHQPGDSFTLPDIKLIDKAGHFILYALLSLSILYVPSRKVRISRPKTVATAAAICSIIYGISDEFHQSFILGRYSSTADILADGCGAVVVCLIWLKWLPQDSHHSNAKRY